MKRPAGEELPQATPPQPSKQYDVVAGLPSYMEEEGISFVTSVIDKGCQLYFPGKKCLLLNADCKSTDETKKKFLETETVCDKEFHCTAITAEGKGAGLRLVFQRMVEVNAPMGFCVDTDLTTITPEWVRSFASALLGGCDMATPRYQRHRCDGTITNLVTYPVVSALFGQSVRQPIGGDFAFSLKAVKAYLEPEWTPTIKKYGIDIFMTTTVISKDFKLVEVELPAKVHSPSLPKLVGMVEQVVGTLLAQIKMSEDAVKAKLAQEVLTPDRVKWGGGGDMSVPEMDTDPKVLAGKAKECFEANKDLLVAETPKAIIPDIAAAVESAALSAALWAELLFWGIGEYCQRPAEKRGAIVKILQLFYLLRAVSHLSHVQPMTNEAAEDVVSEQLELIKKQRPALAKRLSAA
mmetsp:Transcript_8428/g.18915  ORF Transcript_8428/g.18915 Transcript_8428/m.18915 type:complete len:408 (+) Transcript_8428:104-1327(+)|eukprot:CAMPEP_0178431260 /NCGR_PEP_ID=MMETSP0689_2-20121128/31753_1 /TAXON_ID=160604 /ORGANISM="Amphidinium massartii, Strain CS-259" /LENGTH=407 /DNA_ID=CAMNT_0020053161 /DNA_START=50 /DNA_END=1273 /DNA_ORIENTATION=+